MIKYLFLVSGFLAFYACSTDDEQNGDLETLQDEQLQQEDVQQGEDDEWPQEGSQGFADKSMTNDLTQMQPAQAPLGTTTATQSAPNAGQWQQIGQGQQVIEGEQQQQFANQQMPVDNGTPTGNAYMVTAALLHVRGGPGISFPSVGGLAYSDKVQALEFAANGKWVRIGDGQYVSAHYITPIANQNQSLAANNPAAINTSAGNMDNNQSNNNNVASGQTMYVGTLRLHIRSGPGAHYQSLGGLKLGAGVTVQELDGSQKWARIGENMYVSRKYLSEIKGMIMLGNNSY